MITPGQSFDIVVPRSPRLPVINYDEPVLDEPGPPDPIIQPAPYGPDSPNPGEHRQHRWWHSRWCKFGLPGVVLVAAAAIFGSYQTTFGLSQVYLGTTPVRAQASQTTLLKQLHTAQQAYRFQIAYPDHHVVSYAMQDAGVSLDGPATIRDFHAKMQHSGLRKFVWWRPMHFTVTTKADQTALDAFIKTHASSANVAAINAQLDVTSGTASITPAADGSAYLIPGGKSYVLANIARLKATTLSLTRTKLTADIQAKNLLTAQHKADGYTATRISFTISGQTIQVGRADIASWLDISPVPSAHTADVTVNSGKILAYINKLSTAYVKPAVSEVQATDAAGNTTVLVAGSDGIDVVNKNAAAAQAASSLQNAESASIDLPINHVAHTTVKAGDYAKWIVADLTTKRMYAYEHTTLVHSFLISAGAPKTPTVIGQYAIYSKYVSKDMRGRNADGSRYFQPHVHYVNFFYKDYAVHGNYWRPASYFGNINSSHGCIGIPDAEAEWLYNWAPIGTPVITHA